MEDLQMSGGGVSAIPATVGDLALGLSGKADAAHCHPAEDVMGLDDRIEAKRLEAMPETVIDIVKPAGSSGFQFSLSDIGVKIQPGVYAAELESFGGTCQFKLRKSSNASTPTIGVLPSCNVGDTDTLTPQSSVGNVARFILSTSRTIGGSYEYVLLSDNASARLTLRKLI